MTSRTESVRPRRRAAHRAVGTLSSVLVAVALIAACAAGVPDTGPAGGAFYTPPSPLPAGSRGDVIWHRASNVANKPDATSWRILYHSTSATGAPIVVSGSVLVPTSSWAGPGPRPIVAIAPPTQGTGDACAPSRHLGDGGYLGWAEVNDTLSKGFAVAMTDYEGLGTAGLHTYTVGPAMGHAVLDSVRAAQRMPFTNLSPASPVAIYGYSEGGAGAGWAAELAGTYAPELDVRGLVAGGVPADLEVVARNLDGNQGFGFLLAAAAGFDTAYPELDLESYMNDAGRQIFDEASSKCTLDLIATYANRRISDYTDVDPLTRPDWQARVRASKLGQRSPRVPVLMYRGTTDEHMPLGQALEYRDTYCRMGVPVQWNTYETGHTFALALASKDVTTWLADRFAGKPAPNTCA